VARVIPKVSISAFSGVRITTLFPIKRLNRTIRIGNQIEKKIIILGVYYK